MKRKILLTILAVATVFVLVGCSSDNSDERQQEQTEVEEKLDSNIVTEEIEEVEIPLKLTAQNPDIELNVGDQNKLLYTANRDVVVTYASSDEAVATVDENGIVTAVGGGTTTITATCEDIACEWKVISVLNWGKRYSDYFVQALPEIQRNWNMNTGDEIWCDIRYINEDDIPELILFSEGIGFADSPLQIYTIKDEKVTCVWDNQAFIDIFLIYDKTGTFSQVDDWANSEHYYFMNENGIVSDTEFGRSITWDDDGNAKEGWSFNNTEITQEEGKRKLQELTQNKDGSGITGDEEEMLIDDFIATYQ